MVCLESPESRVPDEHPLREIKQLTDAALRRLSPVFDGMYAMTARPSVPPELLRKGRSRSFAGPPNLGPLPGPRPSRVTGR